MILALCFSLFVAYSAYVFAKEKAKKMMLPL